MVFIGLNSRQPRNPSNRDSTAQSSRICEEGYTSSGRYVRNQPDFHEKSSDEDISFIANQLGLYEDNAYPNLENSQNARFSTSTPKKGDREKVSRRLNFTNTSKSLKKRESEYTEKELEAIKTLQMMKARRVNLSRVEEEPMDETGSQLLVSKKRKRLVIFISFCLKISILSYYFKNQYFNNQILQ